MSLSVQMVSDVPICTFCPAGWIQCGFCCVCSKLRRQGKQLVTYSFDFTGNQKYFKANSFQPSQDSAVCRQNGRIPGSEHHYLECDYQTQADLLYDSVEAHDMPCMADVDSSLVYFCQLVGRQHKVVLTGECAEKYLDWISEVSPGRNFCRSGTFPWTPVLAPRKKCYC